MGDIAGGVDIGKAIDGKVTVHGQTPGRIQCQAKAGRQGIARMPVVTTIVVAMMP